MKKIKRLFTFIMLLGLMVLGLGIKTQAQEQTTVNYGWVMYNYYSTYWGARLEIVTDHTNVNLLYVYIPYSDYHRTTIGNVKSNISILKDNDILFSEDLDVFKDTTVLDGWLKIDLVALDAVGFDQINITISQSWSAVPSGYYQFLTDNVDLYYSLFNPYEIGIQWSNVNLYSTYYGLQTTVDVPSGVKTISFYIPDSDFHRFSYGGVDSSFVILENDVIIRTYYLKDLNKTEISELYTLDVTDLDIDNDTWEMFVNIVQSYSTMPDGYLEYMNDNTSITFNDGIRLAKYINNGVEVYQELFYAYPNDYPLSKSGFIFDGWSLADGTIYDFVSPVTDDMLVNNVLYLYAQFSVVDTINPTDPTPSESDIIKNLFATINADNPFGYIIAHIIISVLFIIILNRYSLSVTAMAISLISVTALFIFLGLLPFLYWIIAIGVEILLLFYQLKGSD